MTDGPSSTLLPFLRRLLAPREVQDLPDGELVRRFAARQEETAFAALVRRHGPMVHGVCRRVLHNLHDAEDAFQATFLVLVRKAGVLRKPELLGNWLYGVAYRTALDAKAGASRRRRRETPLADLPAPETARNEAWQDLWPVLDAELNCLPEKYRVPLVLCYLEGKTKEQAARELGWPVGTVSGRLARARDLLRNRLTRRGLALSASLLASALTHNAAAAAVPTPWIASTVQAALAFAAGPTAAPGAVAAPVATLTKGVLQTMLLSKLRVALALVLAVGVAGTGAGLVARQVLAARQTGTDKAEPAPAQQGGDKAKDDRTRIQGVWQVASRMKEGRRPSPRK
jgi:RNA polymerase sigma factor (sigma-70 family)